jgi:hypothetical protein
VTINGCQIWLENGSISVEVRPNLVRVEEKVSSQSLEDLVRRKNIELRGWRFIGRSLDWEKLCGDNGGLKNKLKDLRKKGGEKGKEIREAKAKTGEIGGWGRHKVGANYGI